MGRAHEFSTILEAAHLVRSNQQIVFLFVGDGNQKQSILGRVRELGLDNVVFQPYQPRGPSLAWAQPMSI